MIKNKSYVAPKLLKPSSSLPKKHPKMVEDLEKVFQAAFEAGKFSAALRAKELQIKNLMDSRKGSTNLSEVLLNLTSEELKALLLELENQLSGPAKRL